MFTIKGIRNDYNQTNGYEAISYTKDDIDNSLTVTTPAGDNFTMYCNDKCYDRIIVENSSGKTVENLSKPMAVSHKRG